MRGAAYVLGVAFSSAPAAACTLAHEGGFARFVQSFEDKPVRQAADCSYVNGGNYDGDAGGPTLDLGNGRVAQEQFWVNESQSGLASVFLVDCATAETAEVHGRLEGETSCGPSYSMKDVVAPDGPIDLRSGASLQQLVRAAEQLGIEANTDAIGVSQRLRPRNNVDWFCGCKIFYPDSPGARQ
jgi:hypothetical protein